MYVIKVDGQVLYSPALSDTEYQIVAPKLKYQINKSDSFTFTLPPVHAMKDSLLKMKSVVTVEQDDKEIFRGRVSETNTDFYNQTSVYCEGELSYLLDSLQRPIDFKGTAADFFRLLINNHNSEADADKQFTVGIVSAVTDKNKVDVETMGYASTLSEIRSTLVQRFGGYLRIRRENGVRYIDYLNKYNETSNQKIEFGVNLLDIEKHINVQDIYTVLVPLGKHDGKAQLTIKSVNNGLDYIEDAEGIAKYGRITREHTWDNIEDPQQLLELAQEKLSEATFAETLTINAIDLHLLNKDADSIGLGDSVHILSAPHGYDKELVCSIVDADLLNPENTTYTFGKVEDSLTDNVVANKRSSHTCHVNLKATHSEYELLEGQVEEFYSSFSEVEIKLAAITTTIDLKAEKSETTAIWQSLSSAEAKIDGANAEILLRAKQTTVDALAGRMSDAEASIKVNADAITSKVSKDGLISTIEQGAKTVKISAESIDLSGYVTASTLSSRLADITQGYADEFSTGTLTAGRSYLTTLYLNGYGTYINTGKQVVTAVTLPTVSTDYITYMDANMDLVQQRVVTGFYQGNVSTDTISYVGAMKT